MVEIGVQEHSNVPEVMCLHRLKLCENGRSFGNLPKAATPV